VWHIQIRYELGVEEGGDKTVWPSLVEMSLDDDHFNLLTLK
jgi:hypothetical protein